MPSVFLDTSALLRRYDTSEPGAARVQALCESDQVIIARITAVEIALALSRKRREGSIDAPELNRLWTAFEIHRRDDYQVVVPDEQIHDRAAQLVFVHALRAYDALQIATALRIAHSSEAPDGVIRFCTADRRQAGAAALEGLAVELIA